MNYFLKVALALLLVSSVACTNQSAPAENDLSAEEQLEKKRWDEVMVIHDEVMPKMGDIAKAQKALRTLAGEPVDSTILQQLTELEIAEEAMWTWMHELKPASEREAMAHEAYLKYLDEEEKKISEVRDMMLTSIRNAEAMIAKRTEKTEK